MFTGTLIGVLLSFLALGLAIAVLVFGIILALSYLGGWGMLSRTCQVTQATDKGALLEEKKQRKAWVGLDTYGTLVTARCFERGLELTVAFPFLPPLFLPWEDIRDYQRVSAMPFPLYDQFFVGSRRIRLSNHLEELEKRFGPAR